MMPATAARNSSAVMWSRMSRLVSAYEKKKPWRYPPSEGTRAPSLPASVCMWSFSNSNDASTSAPQEATSATRQPALRSRRSRHLVHCATRSGFASMMTFGPLRMPSR